jgi:hypothetical protein
MQRRPNVAGLQGRDTSVPLLFAAIHWLAIRLASGAAHPLTRSANGAPRSSRWHMVSVDRQGAGEVVNAETAIVGCSFCDVPTS